MKSIYVKLMVLAGLLWACQKEEISQSGIIKEHFYLQNEDAKMPVYVEGNMSSNKILVMVHGGPGDGALYYNIDEATSIAEKKFAIAYWDQRLSGITQANTSDANISSYVDDIKKLIQLLRHRYGQSKQIYLLGHSWGGLLVPHFLEQAGNQSLVNGWIQVDGIHNYVLGDSLTRQDLISFGQEELNAGKHVEEWKEIVDYCTTNDPANNYKVARKINAYANETDDLISSIARGRNTKDLLRFFVREYYYPTTTFLSNGMYNHLIKKIEKQAYDLQVSSQLHEITTPTLLLWGKYDFVAPIGLKDDIAARISSTDVTIKIFNNSGHSPMFNEPADFWATVASWVDAH